MLHVGGERFQDGIIKRAEQPRQHGFGQPGNVGRDGANDKERVGHDHVPGEGNGQRHHAEHRAEAVRVMIFAERKSGDRAETFNAERAEEDKEGPAPSNAGTPLTRGMEMGVDEGEEDQDWVAVLQAKIDKLAKLAGDGPMGRRCREKCVRG